VFEAIKHPRKRCFLGAYSLTGNIKFAAGCAGVRRELHYDWRAADPEYAAAFLRAKEMAGDALEDECKRRAHKGTKEVVLYQGKPVYLEKVSADGVVTRKALQRVKYSDSMMMFLLSGLKSETFHERREIAHSAPEAIALKVDVTHKADLSGLSEDELSYLERLAAKLNFSTS
jgi:hypothetical protein